MSRDPWLPNNPLMLTRLPGGKGRVASLRGSPRMMASSPSRRAA